MSLVQWYHKSGSEEWWWRYKWSRGRRRQDDVWTTMERQCQDARQNYSSNRSQEGDNDTWRQKREARMATKTTMMTMTCVVRTITTESQRQGDDVDDSRIVTTGRWKRWLKHDDETTTTTAETSRSDGDNDDSRTVTTRWWWRRQQDRHDRRVTMTAATQHQDDSCQATSWVQDQVLIRSKILGPDYSVQDKVVV